MPNANKYPFEVAFAEVEANIEPYVDAVFASLQSEFLTLPKVADFIEYATFERGYEVLKRETASFRAVNAEAVLQAVRSTPISLTVLRTIVGFTPPEWAHVATARTGVEVTQGAARALDRKARSSPLAPLRIVGLITDARVRALVETACALIVEGVPAAVTPNLVHRLDKADTRAGLSSLQPVADLGVPYAMLLYERYLGRPFAGYRDSVSGLVGDVVEGAIEEVLTRAGVSYRKTKRAERIVGFEQAPDFIVPDEFNPQIIIEAKLSEDDGTARDKVTRVQHLDSESRRGLPPGAPPRFEVIACIAGRGFKVRRQDMQKLLRATRGKVFTLPTLARLVECTKLSEFRTR